METANKTSDNVDQAVHADIHKGDNIPKKIAAVLCNYNDSRFLIDAVRRIAKQKPDEFIVVDDRSTDESLALLTDLKKQYDFEIIINQGQQSPFGAFVAGCQKAKSEYVACFSADDYPRTDYMWRMRDAIQKYSLVEVFTCNAQVIREGEVYERTLFPFTSYISPDYAVKIFKAGFAKNINQCGIVIKREWVLTCWEGAGKYTEACFDCLYSFTQVFAKGFVNLGEHLTTYRSYPNSFGAASNNQKVKQACDVHKEFYKGILTNKGETTGNFAYQRALESGIWSVKARWKAQIALWGIMKLPYWIRRRFYNWFYSYDQAIEKL